ncbi:glycoside hydrolase family 18 protein [Mycena leptocephala]|nr:glycoside hydrolase family 18 protein [Mycena leptocephala]
MTRSDVVPLAANATSELEVITAAWYPSWGDMQPSDLSWHQYTHMVFSFGITTPDPSNIIGINEDLLADFNVSPMLAIGGRSGSQYFSTAVANSDNRKMFINAILERVMYPGHQGIGCDVVSPDDSANFLLLLRELRKKEPTLELTAAVFTPFTGSDKKPMTDVSEFAKVLDPMYWIELTTVGPNAALRDDCAPSELQFGSIKSVVVQWTEANFPAEKIVLGLAAYGHSFNVTPEAAINQTSRSLNMYSAIGGTQPAGSEGLVTEGFLDSNGNANLNYAIDGCSGTPYVYDQNTHVMVSYNDAKSFGLKAEFINDNGLAGFAVWDATGDYNDILLDSLHSAMGIQDCE